MPTVQKKSSWISILLFFLDFAVLALADTSIYSACQAPTANPLDGCPPNTIWVSQANSAANFSTIQAAISSLPDDSVNYTILIMPGNYIEQLNVTRSAPLTILGQTETPNEQSDNTVTVYWASANSNSRYTDNAFTSVLTVAPNLAASLTGSGPTGYPVPADTPFGNIDFRAYNIDFRNVYSEFSDGPSLAVSVSRANAGFYFSGFYSYQDTVIISQIANQADSNINRSMSGSWEMLTFIGTLLLVKPTFSMVTALNLE
jgi:pectin methylesterase-like acyl-CoA thioesterase